MISRLEIKGFKSLVDVSIELGAVNLFIGANGSGKSNLLEAVGMLGAIASGSLDAESLSYRGVRSGTPVAICTSLKDVIFAPVRLSTSDGETDYRTGAAPNPNSLLRWTVTEEEIDFKGARLIERERDGIKVFKQPEGYHAKLPYNQAARSDTRTSISLSRLGMQSLPDGRFQLNQVTNKSEVETTSEKVVEFLDYLSSFAIFTPVTSHLRGYQFTNEVPRDPLGLGGGGLGKAINEMTKPDSEKFGPFDNYEVYELIEWSDELITEQTDTLGHDGPPFQLRIGDRFMGPFHKSVTALEASEGALYVLFLLALVGHERSPKFFAVDSFDQALHPRLACALTRLISDQILADGSRQMLATTHNPLVLDGLDLLDDRVRLFTVDRDLMGSSKVERVVVTEELIEQGFSLSRLWTSGRLGGVPRFL